MTQVAIISSYRYDDTHIDDNRAWNTVYTVFYPETNTIATITESTGFGENIFEGMTIVETTSEIKAAYEVALAEVRQKEAERLFDQYSKELAEYNKSLRPQKVGQIVEIMDGRRKGKICRISWIGKGKKFGFDADAWYRKAYPMAAAFIAYINHRPWSVPAADCDLIRVWPQDGTKPFYIGIDRAKVVEGFEPVEITVETAYKFNVNFNESFLRKWRMGY